MEHERNIRSQPNGIGIRYMGKFLPLWCGLYLGTSWEFFRGGLEDVSRTLKCDDSAAVVVWYED